jgi:hypothetical protein
MNSSLLTRSAFAVAIGVSLIATLHAKGQTIKLTITGPTLSASLDVTDASLLRRRTSMRARSWAPSWLLLLVRYRDITWRFTSSHRCG